jgi:hypothetical protein
VPRGKGAIKENCSPKAVKEYRPIDALTYLSNYAIEGNQNIDERGDDNDENCYSFDTAWLTVIKDVIHTLEKMGEPLNMTEEQQKKIIESMNEVKSLPSLNIKDLFAQIIVVGKKKWFNDEKVVMTEYECSSESDCIGAEIIKGMENLINSPGFDKYSNTTTELTQNPEDLIDILEKFEDVSQDIKADATKNIIDLFTTTLLIMNSSDDLTNIDLDKDLKKVKEPTSDLSKIEKVKYKFEKLQLFFKEFEKVEGGGIWKNIGLGVLAVLVVAAVSAITVFCFPVGIGAFAFLGLQSADALNKYQKSKKVKVTREKFDNEIITVGDYLNFKGRDEKKDAALIATYPYLGKVTNYYIKSIDDTNVMTIANVPNALSFEIKLNELDKETFNLIFKDATFAKRGKQVTRKMFDNGDISVHDRLRFGYLHQNREQEKARVKLYPYLADDTIEYHIISIENGVITIISNVKVIYTINLKELDENELFDIIFKNATYTKVGEKITRKKFKDGDIKKNDEILFGFLFQNTPEEKKLIDKYPYLDKTQYNYIIESIEDGVITIVAAKDKENGTRYVINLKDKTDEEFNLIFKDAVFFKKEKEEEEKEEEEKEEEEESTPLPQQQSSLPPQQSSPPPQQQQPPPPQSRHLKRSEQPPPPQQQQQQQQQQEHQQQQHQNLQQHEAQLRQQYTAELRQEQRPPQQQYPQQQQQRPPQQQYPPQQYPQQENNELESRFAKNRGKFLRRNKNGGFRQTKQNTMRKTKRSKTKQRKTKRSKTKQRKTKRSKTKQRKTKRSKTKRSKTRKNKISI